jgi:DNA invertase Pin-like site-specific DNA recombinase
MYLGNHDQNMKDKAERGRAPGPKGADSVLAKLTEDDVRDIRLFRLIGATKPAIALLFGVSAACIKDIWQRRTYRNVS